MDFGTALTDDNRTSLIIDPPDGRIPWVEGREGSGGYGDAFSGRPPAGPEDRALPERCLMGLNSGRPMRPGAYNQNVQLFQIPGYVVLLNEMIHNARIVPLDGRPHGTIPQWVGDSRGRWDGDTLVVETTNFLRETHFEGSSANMHLVERFTRVGAASLVYEFTVEDPRMWTRPWTVRIPMRRTDGPLYEYACHEAELRPGQPAGWSPSQGKGRGRSGEIADDPRLQEATVPLAVGSRLGHYLRDRPHR